MSVHSGAGRRSTTTAHAWQARPAPAIRARRFRSPTTLSFATRCSPRSLDKGGTTDGEPVVGEYLFDVCGEFLGKRVSLRVKEQCAGLNETPEGPQKCAINVRDFSVFRREPEFLDERGNSTYFDARGQISRVGEPLQGSGNVGPDSVPEDRLALLGINQSSPSSVPKSSSSARTERLAIQARASSRFGSTSSARKSRKLE